uniref:Small ribosomal subunit protein bS16c n=1 Tax=Chaetoceros pseudocurvisetus TaxID=426637 RepID=A0A8F5PNI7_9STRA|nr:ribosomal protein S16 [Chaetoceros pseudocurvisetus]
MLKLRLTRIGRKKQPVYRLVVIEHSTRRDGRPVDFVGYYNPLTKESSFKVEKIQKWLNYGVQPSKTVATLLRKAQIIE